MGYRTLKTKKFSYISINKMTGYGLDGLGSILGRGRLFSSPPRPDLPRGQPNGYRRWKAAETWKLPLTSI